MAEIWVCPRANERKEPARDDELPDAACWECPYLMKHMDEQGVVTLQCLVYRNRFGSAQPPRVLARQRTKAAWDREALDEPNERSPSDRD
jgi:hypothetical protein